MTVQNKTPLTAQPGSAPAPTVSAAPLPQNSHSKASTLL